MADKTDNLKAIGFADIPVKKEMEVVVSKPMDVAQKAVWLEDMMDAEIIRKYEGMESRELVNDAMRKVAMVYNLIASSFTMEEVKAMTTKDKINALKALNPIHELVNRKSKNGTTNIFQQLNIGKAGKEELEAMMMDASTE